MALFKHDSNQNAIIKEIQVINESTRVTFPYIVQRDGYNCTPKAIRKSVPFMNPKDEEKRTKLESRTMHKGLDSLQEMRCNMFCSARVFVLRSYMHVSLVRVRFGIPHPFGYHSISAVSKIQITRHNRQIILT
ncbi:hypothetical protein AVEN_162457-1 [Araneus ventricosus]|uniref:Uncharacterized protein n=1 Tax=Araneus ventricosus TaxID=182803 RepID=A0A4Y2UZL6_ARAVE|nr:hypothetical protein AVEN_162457-1 [Araneus ventricosus]